MAGRFVRASKYRHVFGRSTKKEQCYDNLHISQNAWDTNLIKVNPKYISVNWESGGGGAFAVIPLHERGRVPEQIPLFRGHTAAVLDTDWSPFNDSLVVSSSDDGKVFVWKVPEGFTLYTDAEEPADVSPVAKLTGHSRKVGHVLFNPSAANVLASSSGDYTVRLWDVESGSSQLTLKHSDIVQSLSWSANGSLLVTTCRDKKLRIWDVRQETPVHEGQGHTGAKNSRCVWMGEHDRLATTGFSRMSDRQLGLWDIRSPSEPIGGFHILDSISGICMPFWDDGTQCLYLAGRGDGNIRYFEYENDKFEFLSEYKSADPQRGVAFLPKRGVNIHENEVMRAYKTVNDSYIEPVSFIVPRRAEVFQGDIFPPTVGLRPSMSAGEWFGGKEALPPKISLESLYQGEEPEEVPSDYKPPSRPAGPSRPKSELEAPKQTAGPVTSAATRQSQPSIKESGASIAQVASRYVDKEEEEGEGEDEEDESSSFEEIPEPAGRASGSTASRMEEKTAGPEVSKAPLPRTEALMRPEAASAATNDSKASASQKREANLGSTPHGSADASAGGATDSVKSYMQEIRGLLQQQDRKMSTQMDQVAHLTAEVDALKVRVDTLKARLEHGKAGGEKDERIRQLELELEEARS